MGTFKQTILVDMKCKSCHSSDRKHKGNGLCTRCFMREYMREARKKLSTEKN